mmetsp:Transcript_51764/g.125476  ORF Transcript_51764/g.125476 Transcript_51764/m.125476 type:complete len:461 (+) Transcript_51764:94-1476(+)
MCSTISSREPTRPAGLRFLAAVAGSCFEKKSSCTSLADPPKLATAPHRPGGSVGYAAAYTLLVHPASSILCVIGEDGVRPRPLEAQQRLEHGLLLVQPPPLDGRLHHRVLPRHVVGRDGQVGVVLEELDDVEVWHPGLDHQHVGPLGGVEGALDERLPRVGGVHLVRLLVGGGVGALAGGRVERVAEWAVEGRGVLGRVGDAGNVGEAVIVKSVTDGADAAVHHVRGGDNVGARLGLGDHLPAQLVHRLVVHDAPHAAIAAFVRRDHSVVPLVRVGVQGDVRPNIDLPAVLVLDPADHLGNHALVVVALVSAVGLEVIRHLGEEDHVADPLRDRLPDLLEHRVERVALAARHGGDGLVLVLGVEEEGVDKVARLDLVLPRHAADTLILAVAPGARALRNPHVAGLVLLQSIVGVGGQGAGVFHAERGDCRACVAGGAAEGREGGGHKGLRDPGARDDCRR